MALTADRIRIHKQRGKFVVRARIRGPRGIETWSQLATFSTQRAASEYRDRCIEIGYNSSTPAAAFAVGVWLPYRARALKPSSQENRLWATRRINEALGTVALRDIDEDFVQAIVDSWCAELSHTSARQLLKRLRSVLTLAVKKGLLSENPADAVPLPPADARERPICSDDEIDAFAAVAHEHRYAAAWELLLSNGLRRAEVLGLEWPYVDLTAKKVTVVKTIVAIGGHPLVQDAGKTPSARREIPIDDLTCQLLRARREQQQAEYDLIGTPMSKRTAFVFTNLSGGHLAPRSFARTYEYLCDLAQVRPICIHDVRHTFATRMLRHISTYGEMLALSKMMGHSSVTVTLELYGHALPGEGPRLHAAMIDAHRRRTASTASFAPDQTDAVRRRQSSRLIRPIRRS